MDNCAFIKAGTCAVALMLVGGCASTAPNQPCVTVYFQGFPYSWATVVHGNGGWEGTLADTEQSRDLSDQLGFCPRTPAVYIRTERGEITVNLPDTDEPIYVVVDAEAISETVATTQRPLTE